MYFHYFVIISPSKRVEPFIWTNLNPLHPRMLCAKFGWNWLSGHGSGEEDEYMKSLRQQRQRLQRLQRRQRRQRRTTDKFWSEKLTWAFGSGELKTGILKVLVVNLLFQGDYYWASLNISNCFLLSVTFTTKAIIIERGVKQ